MIIRSFYVANYKAYRQPTTVEIKPLTLLIGRNHAGKSALMKALPLLVDSLASGSDELVSLDARGIFHGLTVSDLNYGGHIQGEFELGVTFDYGAGPRHLVIQVLGQNTRGKPADLARLEVSSAAFAAVLSRNQREYTLELRGEEPSQQRIDFEFEGWLRTLLRLSGEGKAGRTIAESLTELRESPSTISYLKSPRSIWSQSSKPGWQLLSTPGTKPSIDGSDVLWSLAMDEELLSQIRDWFSDSLGVSLQVRTVGEAFRILVGSGFEPGQFVGLENAGQGLSQLLPVVVRRLEGLRSGAGIDFVEQPEAELHPAVEGAVADLFLADLTPNRPAVVETHSEVFLLRTRRRIAEGKVDPNDVKIYWVDAHEQGGARLNEIKILPNGDIDVWPEGVFYEDYEEVLAIRKAARSRG